MQRKPAVKKDPMATRPAGTYPAPMDVQEWIPYRQVGDEQRVTDPDTGGQKGEKPEAYALIPVEALAEVARVYGYGAKKYEPNNWRKGYSWSLSYSALQRHLNAFWSGEERDPESGLPHLAHAVFHCLTLLTWSADEALAGKDDRA